MLPSSQDSPLSAAVAAEDFLKTAFEEETTSGSESADSCDAEITLSLHPVAASELPDTAETSKASLEGTISAPMCTLRAAVNAKVLQSYEYVSKVLRYVVVVSATTIAQIVCTTHQMRVSVCRTRCILTVRNQISASTARANKVSLLTLAYQVRTVCRACAYD